MVKNIGKSKIGRKIIQVNLLKSLPKSSRNVSLRANVKTPEIIKKSKEFGYEYFDGDRCFGYGGYKYDGRWIPVASDIIKHFNLKEGDRVLDVGCAKGFLVKDLVDQGIEAYGVDISQYALDNSIPEIKDRLILSSCDALPYEDNSFDAVLSINTIHNLDRARCIQSCMEIERLAPGKGFIQVDSYYNEKQKKIFESWVLTANFYGYPYEWIEVFKEAKYTGDWYWTIMD